MAAVLACGEGALLSGPTAAALWDLQSVPSGPVDVTAAGHSRRRIQGIRFHGVRSIHPDDRTVIDGIPVASLARTLLDRARTLHPQRLRTLMEQAQRRDLLDVGALDALLSRSRGRHGTAALRTVRNELNDEAPWTQSKLERSFLEFVRDRRLPEPQTNVLVDGCLVDCFWPEHNLIAELDSYEFHRGRGVFEADRRKDIAHTRAGRQSIHITQRMITRDASALQQDLEALLDAHSGRRPGGPSPSPSSSSSS
jgi:very-short-patch-repair endonuclease